MALKSIRWRLTLSYAGIALLSVLVLGLVLVSIMRIYYAEQESAYLLGNAKQIASTVPQLLQSGLPKSSLENQVSSWSFLLQARIQVLDPSGKVIADSGIPENQQSLVVSSLPGPAVLTSSINAGGGTTTSVQGTGVSGLVELPPWGIFIVKPDVVTQSDAQSSCNRLNIEPGNFFTCQTGSFNPVTTTTPNGNSIESTTPSPESPSQMPVGISIKTSGSLFGFNLDPAASVTNHRSSDKIILAVEGPNRSPIGQVIISDGPAYGDEIVNGVTRGWLFASVFAVLLAAALGWWVSRRMTTPLTTLTAATASMAAGNLSVRAGVQSKDEFGELSHSFDLMAERVEEIVATLRGFVADAAHQLMTPLTALRTNLELAEDETNAGRQAEFLSAAKSQMARMETLVGELLELSRLEANGFTLPQEPFDLKQTVSEAAEAAASRAEQGGRLFSLDLPEGPVAFYGDPSRLRHALDNLLDNALKFTPPGGRVRLRLSEDADGVTAAVEDSGSGIPAEDIPHLFERFYRGSNSAGIPGSGLGLAIVKAIVEMHHGKVVVESAGQGTKVELRFPPGNAHTIY